jgi:hypothetical protein
MQLLNSVARSRSAPRPPFRSPPRSHVRARSYALYLVHNIGKVVVFRASFLSRPSPPSPGDWRYPTLSAWLAPLRPWGPSTSIRTPGTESNRLSASTGCRRGPQPRYHHTLGIRFVQSPWGSPPRSLVLLALFSITAQQLSARNTSLSRVRMRSHRVEAAQVTWCGHANFSECGAVVHQRARSLARDSSKIRPP